MKAFGPAVSALAALLLLLPAVSLGQAMPGMPASPCTWTGTSQVVCTGQMENYDAYDLLHGMLDAAAASGTVSVKLSTANITGIQLPFLRAVAFAGAISPTFLIAIENSVVSKMQLVMFGALAAQAGLNIDLQVSGSQILDNQITLAAGIASGGAGRASLTAVNSDVRGNMVATAGALALSSTAEASASGSGGSASNNVMALAGLVASGAAASARASFEGVPAESNGMMGIGMPLVEDPLVSSVIGTVMNAVFVDSSTLGPGLASIQTQICASMSNGGSLETLAYDLGFQAVRDVAWAVLCDPTSTSNVQLSDIPAMLDGTAGPGATGTFTAMRLLATGKGRLHLKSLGSALAFAKNHPQAAADLLSVLSVSEDP